mmetsp:Transcript_25428/g.59905  ORF Transcript_25428/g.59905 Transcript_25428/m.59905 type:complete len:207 (-) Transcript_25428:341-961(-)
MGLGFLGNRPVHQLLAFLLVEKIKDVKDPRLERQDLQVDGLVAGTRHVRQVKELSDVGRGKHKDTAGGNRIEVCGCFPTSGGARLRILVALAFGRIVGIGQGSLDPLREKTGLRDAEALPCVKVTRKRGCCRPRIFHRNESLVVQENGGVVFSHVTIPKEPDGFVAVGFGGRTSTGQHAVETLGQERFEWVFLQSLSAPIGSVVRL